MKSSIKSAMNFIIDCLMFIIVSPFAALAYIIGCVVSLIEDFFKKGYFYEDIF